MSTPTITGTPKKHHKTKQERELTREVSELRRERELLQAKEAEQAAKALQRESELQRTIENLTKELEKLNVMGAQFKEKNQQQELAMVEASRLDLTRQLQVAHTRLEASMMAHRGGAPASGAHAHPNGMRVEASVSSKDQNTIDAKWDLGSIKPSPQDWIGLYIHNREFSNKYTLYSNTEGKSVGETSFPNLKPGTYDVRLFLAGSQVEQTRSGAVLIGPGVSLTAKPTSVSSTPQQQRGPVRAFEVTWEDEKKEQDGKDWIGLFKVTTKSNKKWLSYQYVSSCAALIFAAPRTPGEYEFRYFRAGSGNIYSGRSNIVVVPNVDFLEMLPDAPGKVAWGCFSHDPSKWDWLGLYTKGADSHKYVESKYVTDGVIDSEECDSGVVSFDLSTLKPGEYEIRFFNNSVGKYTPLLICPIILQ